MSDVTQILERLEDDDPEAIRQLFTVVYGELRKLAAHHLQSEQPGQTLQATALVHEAWLKLTVSGTDESDGQRVSESAGSAVNAYGWKCRSHFFGAAAEAMRRILVDNARRKKRLKRGGNMHRTTLDLDAVIDTQGDDMLETLDQALQKFQAVDPIACELVKLRYFAGMSLHDASKVLDIAPRTADRLWAYAKAWLLREMQS